LLKIQAVDRGDDLLGKAGNTLPQSVLLTQFFAFTDERFTLGFKCSSPGIQFLPPTQQFVLLYEAGSIQICDSATLGTNGVNLSVEAGELCSKQFIPGRLAMSGYCILTGEQHLRPQ
jgi:hypothetical protein